VDKQLPGNITPFQIAVLVLSLFVVVSLALELIVPFSPETMQVLLYVDTLICVVFFADFLQQFRSAPSKREYMKLGWLDLISCIPLMDFNQFARIIRVVRLIKAIKSISMLTHALSKDKAASSLHFVIVTSLMMMVFGSIYILYLERGIPGANIDTAADAFWWTFITITTVGYGDYFPVTFEGRVVAIVLITTGVGMFGSLTAVLSSWILSPEDERARDEAIKQEVVELRQEVRELKQLLLDTRQQR